MEDDDYHRICLVFRELRVVPISKKSSPLYGTQFSSFAAIIFLAARDCSESEATLTFLVSHKVSWSH